MGILSSSNSAAGSPGANRMKKKVRDRTRKTRSSEATMRRTTKLAMRELPFYGAILAGVSSRTDAAVGSRRLLTASLLLGVFVLFDLGLLGWLIFRSLSQREIEQVLLETRAEAEELAGQLAGGVAEQGKDLYTLIAIEREKQTYIDSILQKRDIVQRVEIRDRDGRLVFRALGETFHPPQVEGTPQLESGEVTPRVDESTRRSERTIDYDMDVPIGDVGILHIGISQFELEKRIGVLRGELVRQTSLIGAVTLVVLLLAYGTIWWLWRRSRDLEEQAAEAERCLSLPLIGRLLGHKRASTTERYAHLADDPVRDAADRVQGRLADRLARQPANVARVPR